MPFNLTFPEKDLWIEKMTNMPVTWGEAVIKFAPANLEDKKPIKNWLPPAATIRGAAAVPTPSGAGIGAAAAASSIKTGTTAAVPEEKKSAEPSASSSGRTSTPLDAPPLKANCWESVLVAGYLAGLWDKEYIALAISPIRVRNKTVSSTKLHAYMRIKGKRIIIPANSTTTAEKANYLEWDLSHTGEFGSIAMLGLEGEHFMLTAKEGKVIEIDKHAKGVSTWQDVLSRGPYTYKANEIFVSAPPTREELEALGPADLKFNSTKTETSQEPDGTAGRGASSIGP